MKIQYMACARSSCVDRTTNELSLFQMLDEIGAASFPLQLPSFCVAALFVREPDDEVIQHFVMSMTLDGTLLASFTRQIDFSRSRRNRNVNTLTSLVLPKPGVFRISLSQKDTVLGAWETVAIQTGAPAKVVAAPPAPRPNEKRAVPAKPGPTVN